MTSSNGKHEPASAEEILRSIDHDSSSLEYVSHTAGRFLALRDYYENSGDTVAAERAQWDVWAWYSYWVDDPKERKSSKRWYNDALWNLPPEADQHFQSHLGDLHNPYLQARYGTLLWQRQKDHNAARIAVDDHLHVTTHLLTSDPEPKVLTPGIKNDPWFDLHEHLETALEISLCLNDHPLVANVKDKTLETLLEVVKRGQFHHVIEIAGALVRNHLVLNGSELDLLDVVIGKGIEGLIGLPEESFHLERNLREHQIGLRKARGAPESMITGLKVMQGESFIREANFKLRTYPSPHFVAASLLRQAQQVYHRLGLRSKVEDLEIEIQDHQKVAVTTEMGVISMELEIDLTKFDPWIDSLLAMPLPDALQSIGLDKGLLPDIGLARREAAEQLAGNPLLRHLPMKNMRQDREIRTSSTPEEHAEAAFKQEVLWQINPFLASALRRAFARLREKKARHSYRIVSLICRAFARLHGKKLLNAEVLTAYLKDSPFLAGRDMTIMKVGIERYFAGDFVSCLHILVPQFEDSFREFLANSGTVITKTEKGRTQKRLLNDLLDDGQVKALLDDSLYWYIHLLLNSEDGFNLRHDVAHGLISPDQCAEWSCTLVLHSFIVFAAVSRKAVPGTQQNQHTTAPTTSQ